MGYVGRSLKQQRKRMFFLLLMSINAYIGTYSFGWVSGVLAATCAGINLSPSG